MAGKKSNLPVVSSNLPVVIESRHPGGRPKGSYTQYLPEIADEVIDRMSWGETLSNICRVRLDGTPRVKGEFPNPWTVGDWADPNHAGFRPEFLPRYARAKLEQQHRWLDKCVEVAITPELGVEEVREYSSKNGVTVRRATKDMLGHRNLQIDTLLKVLSRTNPQLWAERLQQPTPPADLPGEGTNRVIVEGGLPDNEPPPPEDTEQPDDAPGPIPT